MATVTNVSRLHVRVHLDTICQTSWKNKTAQKCLLLEKNGTCSANLVFSLTTAEIR